MAVVDTLITRYTMDNQDYVDGAQGVTKATKDMSGAISGTGGIGDLKNSTVFGFLMTALAALPALIFAGGAAASAAGAEYEAQTKALGLYADGVNTTEKMLSQLAEVAKLPGLGNIEAIQGAVRLLAGGLDFTLAERSLRAFGNALASAGGGKEELDGVILALTQIAAKGAVSAEEINQMAERVPQVREAMKQAFGTANTEAIQRLGITSEAFILGLVGALEQLPKAGETMKNTMSNLGDFMNQALADVGMGLNQYLIGPMNEVARFGEYLKSQDVFTKIGESLGALIGGKSQGPSPLVSIVALLVASLEEMPKILGKMKWLAESIKDSFVEVFNQIANSRFGKIIGMAEIDPGAMLGFSSPMFGTNLINIGKKAADYVAGYSNYTPAPGTPPTGGGFRNAGAQGPTPAETELEKQTAHLSAIERNTSPERNQILGGGSIGAMGVTPQELNASGRGRGKLDMAVRLIAEWAGEAQAKSGADFLKMANPFIGGR